MIGARRSTNYQRLASGSINVRRYKQFFSTLFFVLVVSVASIIVINWISYGNFESYHSKYDRATLTDVLTPPITVISHQFRNVAKVLNTNCTYWSCFNVYNCGKSNNDHIGVYVYPLRKYISDDGAEYTSTISREFYELIETIINSKYYTSNPHEACVFVPTIDILNLDAIDARNLTAILNSLEFWNHGENHLLFTMFGAFSGSSTNYARIPSENAIIAGAGLDTWSLRYQFDVPMPVYSPFQRVFTNVTGRNNKKTWLVISTDTSMHADIYHELRLIEMTSDNFAVFKSCPNRSWTERCRATNSNNVEQYRYPEILNRATFCLVIRGRRLTLTSLLEVMANGCIPVVVADNLIMPFTPHIDWKRSAVFILERNVNKLMKVLKSISNKHIAEMQEQVRWLYRMYFESVKKITLTALDVLQERVYPHRAKFYEHWNLMPSQRPTNPLFWPVREMRSSGFTAVILTYDRLGSLFELIDKLAKVPSLVKILVIWNNQKKAPPPSSLWPKINKSLQVIQTSANKLSNRFYPYVEIETEAILSIDDDILMLTADEIEFGFEAWKEFPDRIVGFPSRTHRWDNTTSSWRYESEWTNDISMVLTGAAFLHKYWLYAYTNLLPSTVIDWVDLHMNCEDIAMNFLVANITDKSPIKVTPRKKFKCPTCTNTEMLSSDVRHLGKRSACVNRFASIFGRMPLRAVEFRADPVLFLDPFPEKLKRFKDIGSL